MTAGVTKLWIAFMDANAITRRDGVPLNFEFFKEAMWRQRLLDPAISGTVTVTLSTGKTVTIDSVFLRLMRILADELAEEESRLN